MPDMDLVQRLREYGRDAVGDAMPVVSSAWLAQVFEVDPRTVAAALRPYGVQPGEVERGVRGYSTAELAGIVLPGDEPDAGTECRDVLEGRVPFEPGWQLVEAAAAAGVAAVEPDAVSVLSAAAGHDMTPALRAAGLL